MISDTWSIREVKVSMSFLILTEESEDHSHSLRMGEDKLHDAIGVAP